MQERKYLGIDWGEARIGLAMADSILKIATPYKVVNNFDKVLEIISEEDIDVVVVGEPFMLSGKSYFVDAYKNFTNKLQKIKDVEVLFFDERLTSKAADSLVGDKKTKAPRDAVAAMIILQSFLERERNE